VFKAADLDQNNVVDVRDVTLFQQRLKQGGVLPLSLDFNRDGKVNLIDARFMTSLCDLPRCVTPS
ncbi:MAG: dockerin type I domain-containing protein, partial [Alishewanella sp.]|nr:dockerin type I domain-containing protein [Alishewanella sp.]